MQYHYCNRAGQSQYRAVRCFTWCSYGKKTLYFTVMFHKYMHCTYYIKLGNKREPVTLIFANRLHE